jgi:hypothetical protein
LRKRRRITRLADGDEVRTKILGGCKLGLGLVLSVKLDVVDAPAAPRQGWQRIDSSFRAAELVDQSPERSGANVLGPDQPQPSDALLVVQPRGGPR